MTTIDSKSPVLSAFLRFWDNALDDDFRQILQPFILRATGTAGDGKDETRAWMATDWLVRHYAPAWLDLCGLQEHAQALRTGPAIKDPTAAAQAQPALNAARDAAWDAARDAARDAAVREGARGAARAARDAWDATWDAAWAAAGEAARDAGDAWGAGGVAAWSAAWSAAWVVARKAAREAREALAPTVKVLQQSALELLDRMITAEWD